MKSGFPSHIIELLIKKTKEQVLENTPVLVSALKEKYSKDIINRMLTKNPKSILKNYLDISPLFAAIAYKAPFEIVQMLFEGNPEAALQFGGATLLSGWYDDGWEKGYNITSLILALYEDRFDVADFLIGRFPQLIEIKDGSDRLPISYINWEKIPLKLAHTLLVLNLSALYKHYEIASFNKLLINKRKEIVELALQLGLGIGAELSNHLTVETAQCVVIGMTINGKAVTRSTAGFAHSITNVEELLNARQQGHLLETEEEFDHYIKLTQTVLMTKKQQEQKRTHDSNFMGSEPRDMSSLIKLERWLWLNKPSSSLAHLSGQFSQMFNFNDKAEEKKRLDKILEDALEETLKEFDLEN